MWGELTLEIAGNCWTLWRSNTPSAKTDHGYWNREGRHTILASVPNYVITQYRAQNRTVLG